MEWQAISTGRTIQKGARVYVFETRGRRPILVGDVINFEISNTFVGSARVLQRRAADLEIELEDGTRLLMQPTPAVYGQPSLNSDITFQDFMLAQ